MRLAGVFILLGFAGGSLLWSAPKKPHVVLLGSPRRVAYSQVGDPAGALQGEKELKIRSLLVDGQTKEWTTGEPHDVTDRSFVVRRAIRLNDSLPGDPAHKSAAGTSGPWVWQRGPWLLVDRITGHISALHLPEYDPGVSQVAWFRDYAAYCGVTASGKSLTAVVAQISARKPVLAKKISGFNPEEQTRPACLLPEWQREPLRVTFHPTGLDPLPLNLAPGSALLVEDTGDD